MEPRWTPTLDDFVDLAYVILGTSPEAIRRLPRITLAESAIHAPFASFAGEPAYPTLVEQARFLDANGIAWGRLDVEVDASAVERIAAGGMGQEEVVAWIRTRTASA